MARESLSVEETVEQTDDTGAMAVVGSRPTIDETASDVSMDAQDLWTRHINSQKNASTESDDVGVSQNNEIKTETGDDIAESKPENDAGCPPEMDAAGKDSKEEEADTKAPPSNHRTSLSDLIRNMTTPKVERSVVDLPLCQTTTPTYFTNGWSALLGKAGPDSDRPSLFASLSSTLSTWNDMRNNAGGLDTAAAGTAGLGGKTDDRTVANLDITPIAGWGSPSHNDATCSDQQVTSTPVSSASSAKKKVSLLEYRQRMSQRSGDSTFGSRDHGLSDINAGLMKDN
jgi:hypothetical protein